MFNTKCQSYLTQNASYEKYKMPAIFYTKCQLLFIQNNSQNFTQNASNINTKYQPYFLQNASNILHKAPAKPPTFYTKCQQYLYEISNIFHRIASHIDTKYRPYFIKTCFIQNTSHIVQKRPGKSKCKIPAIFYKKASKILHKIPTIS